MSGTTDDRRPEAEDLGNKVEDAEIARLRATHSLQVLDPRHDGLGLNRQAPGVFGWTSAPGEANAPLFATPIYQAFEVHKLPDGRALLVGFVTVDLAEVIDRAGEPRQVRLYPRPQADATTLVAVPYDRIRSHKEHSQRSGNGLEIVVAPAP